MQSFLKCLLGLKQNNKCLYYIPTFEEKQGACVSLSISRLNIYQPRHQRGFCCLLNSSKAEITYFIRQKKTPPKAGSLGFSLGVFPSFHSVKKPSSHTDYVSKIRVRKYLRINWLKDQSSLLRMCLANSSQGLAPHTPRRRLSRLLFLCPDQGPFFLKSSSLSARCQKNEGECARLFSWDTLNSHSY